jgi:methionine-rich copper-binding protein CopC
MALEPRILYDGAVVDTAVAAAAAAHAAAAAMHDTSVDQSSTSESHVPAAVEPPVSAPREIVFIDERVSDYQQLVSGSRPDVQVVVIRADQDGLSVIESTLADRSDIAAIHLVTHGSPGEITLGSAVLNSGTLATRENEISAWSRSLAPSADVLIYGCDVAATPEGRGLVDQLSALSGADVAASTNDTGGDAAGGDWTLEYRSGPIEAGAFLTAATAAEYADRLSAINLSGSSGWTAVMFGVNRDPVGDSQAGAADTDIVGDASHGSLYVAFDDNGTATTADDTLVFRMRIDNPTSNTYFGGVADVGLDANADGRLDVFMCVDGRNNGQAVKLLDPGTGANLSPNTTSTQPLPTGWLSNNGVYSFSASNYSVVAVSSATDPHWNGDNDLGNDSKTDVFVSWRIPLGDLATVLAKPSAVDRNGNYGPRGATGISGFTQNTVVQYVNFTQTQTGPINGDLNGVGSSYDKNATFAVLGATTAAMSAQNPIAAGPTLSINEPAGGSIGADGIWSGSEDASITLTGTSSSLAQGSQVTVRVTAGLSTRTATGSVQSDGTWSATFAGGQAISGLADGTLSIQASADPDGNGATSNDIQDSASILHDRTPPTIAIDQLASAVSGLPTFTGTSDLPNGSLITVTIDTDNNSATANLVYQVMVTGGVWSLNTATVTPASGTVPSGGLTSYSSIIATATDAAGNSATAIALNRPTVTTLSTSSTTPTITGTWSATAGDVLTVSISGATYTLSPSGNTWSLNLATASPSSGALTPLVAGSVYSVTATVTRGGANVSDTTSSELSITNTPVKTIDITGGATASGSDTTPTISGTSGNAGGFVIVRLDPSNDGNLTDAVTYSVATDGSGNWTLDTGSATPISGTVPSGGFVGATGILATDSTGAVSDAQVLTISTPLVAIGSITSAATADAFGQISNASGGASYLNVTEDNSVTISGTATNGFTVNLVISDASGNSVTVNNIAVSGGAWSASAIDLSNLDNGTLTVRATLSGTALSATNTSVTHDKTPNQIFITNQTTIPKSQATISGSSTLGSGVALTVTVRDSGDTSTIWTGTATTTANGDWTVTSPNGTNFVSGNSGNVIIKVAPTSTNTDAAGNVTQQVARNPQAVQNGASNTSDTIAISTIAGDNIITANEIASGLSITGTTNLTTAATSAFLVTVSDGTTTQTATIVSNVSGTWTATLTQAQMQALKNGSLVVTARVNNTTSGIAVSDVELPTLSLATPTLAITDDTPGTATGDVVFTFTFSESMTGFTAGDITISSGTKGTFSGSGTTYTLAVTPPVVSSGTITVSVASTVATGSTSGRANAAASTTQVYDTTGAAAAPTLTIDADDLAVQSRPLITGTTNLAAGAPILITIDPDNNSATSNTLIYSATVQSGGTWSLDISSATPTSGTLPVDGLLSYAKITAVATNAFGNSTTVVALDKPAVTAQITNDSTPAVSGTWTNLAGDTLSVTVTPTGGGGGTTYSVGTGLVISGNTWSFDSSALADGTYHVTATASRGGATKTDVTSSELTVDTVATVDITGGATVSTNDATPVIAGVTTGIPAGTLLTLRLDPDNNGSYDLVYRTTVQPDGSWSVDTNLAIPFSGSFPTSGLDGTVPMQASATDAAGNVGSDAQTLNVDRIPPAIGITSGTRTPDSTPLITGTTDLAPLSTITLNIDPNNDGDWSDQQTYTATVQTDRTWSVQTTTVLTGTVKVRASGADPVGNTATTEAPLTIDLSAPTVSVDAVATANSDFTADSSEDDAVVISGTTTAVPDGSTLTVIVTDGTMTISDTATVSGGVWQLAPLNLSALANGTISVTATFVDGGGNSYPAATSFQHDKSATVAIDSISQDTGLIADFITKDSTVSIAGSATASATVNVVVRDALNVVVASFSVTANGSGQWSTAPTGALTPGTYTIAATVGGTTVSRAMTIVDAVAPTLVASSPADDATSFALADNLTLTFSKIVVAGTGFITLYRADGTLLETFNVASGTGDNGGSLSFNGTSLITLNPGQNLTLATSYYLHIDASAVIDSAGNAYAGIANATSLNFATGSGISAPSQSVSIASMTLDTGVSSTDFITANGASGRTVAGAVSAALGVGEVVEVSFDGGSTWTQATTIGTDWTLVDPGSHSSNWMIQARVRNNTTHLSGSIASQSVQLDTGVPATPTVNSLLTTDLLPTLTGAATVSGGESLTITVNGATYTVTPVSGAWSLDLATAIPTSGALGSFVVGSSYPVTATITDIAGNSASDLTTNELTIAATGPTQTPAIVAMTLDTGVSATDFITANGSAGRTVSGTLTSALVTGEIVEVSFDGGTTWTPATTVGTDWALVDAGSHSSDWTIKARVTNNTTLVSGPIASQSVQLDTVAPAVPTVNSLLTTDLLPLLTGAATASAGESLTIAINGATYTVTPVSGAWSLDLATAVPTSGSLGSLVVGSSYSVTATIIDTAGHSTSDATSQELTIAATGPTQTPAIVSMTLDTGISATDFITADGSAGRTVSGTLTSTLVTGEIVEVSFDGGTTWTPATTSGTNWTVVDASSHAGSWNLQARVTNSLTLVSGPAAFQSVTLDAIAPTTPTVNSSSSTSTLPTVTGTASVGEGERLLVSVNSATYELTVQNGVWTLDLATTTPISGTLGTFSPGNVYSVAATVTDEAGNSAVDLTNGELTIVFPQTAPTQIVSIDSMTQDTGLSPLDFLTRDGSAGRTVSGTLSAALNINETLQLSFDGGITWVNATVSGVSWTASDPLVHESDWTIQAHVVNTAIDAVGPTTNQSVVLDKTLPATPTVDPLFTANALPRLSGSATLGAGESLTLSVNGATYAVSVTNGLWSLDLATATPLSGSLATFAAGQAYSVTAAVTDSAGNVSTDLSSGELTIAPPQLPPQPQPLPIEPPRLEPLPMDSSPAFRTPGAESPLTLSSTESLGSTGTPFKETALESFSTPLTNGLEAVAISSVPVEVKPADRGLYTRADGFQVIVLKPANSSGNADGEGADHSKAALLVNRGVPDMQFDNTGREIEVAIPRDAFAHNRNDAVISLSVLQSNGEPLPTWLVFDPRLGVLRGVPPADTQGEIEVRVIARDQDGNQVEVTFRVKIQKRSDAALESPLPLGKAGLSQQLLAAGKWGRARAHGALIELARANASREKISARG